MCWVGQKQINKSCILCNRWRKTQMDQAPNSDVQLALRRQTEHCRCYGVSTIPAEQHSAHGHKHAYSAAVTRRNRGERCECLSLIFQQAIINTTTHQTHVGAGQQELHFKLMRSQINSHCGTKPPPSFKN